LVGFIPSGPVAAYPSRLIRGRIRDLGGSGIDSNTGGFAWRIISCSGGSENDRDRSFCIISNRIGDSRYINIFAIEKQYPIV
jgi:hypothetical protein